MQVELDQNLTGRQRMQILDGLTYLGIEAVFQTTTFIEPYLIGLLSWSIRNRRRKISNAPRELQASLLSNVLFSNDPGLKLRCFMAYKPDRYILVGLLRRFLEATEGYENEDRRGQRRIERAVRSKDSPRLYGAIRTVRDSLQMAMNFRNSIVEEYYLLCRQEANRLRTKSAIKVSEEDLTHNLVNGVILAIDKYDHDNGALTSYIRPWMRYLSQSPKFGHEQGLAYDIPHNHRMRIVQEGRSNVGATIDEALENTLGHGNPTQDSLEHDEQANRLLRLLQLADPKGLMRLQMGVEEYLSERHKRLMLRQAGVKRVVAKATQFRSGHEGL